MQTVKKAMIVSLSSGIIGEPYVSHEVELGIKRLNGLGVEVCFSTHAKLGLDYLKKHPEARASDLLEAFQDDSVDMVLCAIGGDDTYSLLPYLFEHEELQKVVKSKVFLGFSDSTVNHLMLHKVGINTFYGQSFLADICEIGDSMLPYSEQFLKELILSGKIEHVSPSSVWYEERTDYSINAMGTPLVSHQNMGFELLRGKSIFSGQILGGCIDTLFDLFDNTRYPDSVSICSKYQLFPQLDDWKGKILLLETSEECPVPNLYRRQLQAIKSTGIFEVINGVIVGKPMNECYYDEYKEILLQELPESLSIAYNINIGHGQPRCIIPFGVNAIVDTTQQVIRFMYQEEK